jgi:hypothetical protein
MKLAIHASVLALALQTTSAGTINYIHIKKDAITRIDTEENNDEYFQGIHVYLDGKLCKILDTNATEADWIKMSSDKQYLVLFNGYIEMKELKTCDSVMKLSGKTTGAIDDMNKEKDFLVEQAEDSSHGSCQRLSIRNISTKQVVNIPAGPFFTASKFSSSLAGSASFSPDGQYLALSTSHFSCRKGSYPGVYDTQTWEKVEFTTPDVDARCDALFPNLPPPSRVQQPVCVEPGVGMR